jgi:hypothetical protein
MVSAGGQSLLPAMIFRLSRRAPRRYLTDAGLKGSFPPDCRQAMARPRPGVGRESAGGQSAEAQALAYAARSIRNRGTVVGSLCHADAAAETPMILLLLGGGAAFLMLRSLGALAACLSKVHRRQDAGRPRNHPHLRCLDLSYPRGSRNQKYFDAPIFLLPESGVIAGNRQNLAEPVRHQVFCTMSTKERDQLSANRFGAPCR